MTFSISDQKGFTLIELISIMVILGVMASVSVKKLDLLSGSATDRVLQDGIKELNVREYLVWTDLKLSSTNWTNDGDVFSKMNTDLGQDYVWAAGPDASGGTLRFRNQAIVLTRIPSTTSSTARWK